MRNDLTDITIVLDVSGSMHSCKGDTEGGLKTFLAEQREQPGDAVVTLVTFHNDYEFQFIAKPVQEIEDVSFSCGGMTGLNDALACAIDSTGVRLAQLDEADRPGVVLFVVITDGRENASFRATAAQVRERITHQQDKYNWQFVYLGAEHDAHQQASGLGFKEETTSGYSKCKTGETYTILSAHTSAVRGQSLAGDSPTFGFTADDVAAMN